MFTHKELSVMKIGFMKIFGLIGIANKYLPAILADGKITKKDFQIHGVNMLMDIIGLLGFSVGTSVDGKSFTLKR